MSESTKISPVSAVTPTANNSAHEPWRVVIIGGGPGGYEAALVAAQLGAHVSLIERQGCGGAAVLTDVVPSKTLIAAAGVLTEVHESHELGITIPGGTNGPTVNFAQLNNQVRDLAAAQSADIHKRLCDEGVTVINGTGVVTSEHTVTAHTESGAQLLNADVILLAVGTTPRELPTAVPDGERILTWKQLYDLDQMPERLIVVGSGVTGAEFAGAYDALGVDVVLVSSRDQVLPGEDPDAAAVLEKVYRRRGMEILNNVRANAVARDGDKVHVTLSDGQVITGSHCLMAVGSIPNTQNVGLEEAGVQLSDSGHVEIDRVSRTSVRSIYAAGDCTGVFPLASVAAMQGRIAMWHALGDAVAPLELRTVSANIFTSPEIATVGIKQCDVDADPDDINTIKLSFDTNPRAKMQGFTDGFVKVFSRRRSGVVIGAVVVAPHASELIHALSVAVDLRLTVDQIAHTFTVYPSLSGSIAEATRQLHRVPDL